MRYQDIKVGNLYQLKDGSFGRVKAIHAHYTLGGSGKPHHIEATLTSPTGATFRVSAQALKTLVDEA